MGILKKRYEQFVARRKLPKDDPKNYSLFAEHISNFRAPSTTLDEHQAFRIYNDFRVGRKKLYSNMETNRIAAEKYSEIYDTKKFKKILSRKSLNFLNQALISVNYKDLYILARWKDFDNFGNIRVVHIAFQEFQVKNREYFFLTGYPGFESGNLNKKHTVLYIGHFFERYAERTKLPYKNMKDIILQFLLREYKYLMDFVVGVYSNSNQCYCSLNDGMCLGHKVKDIFILKTFVHGDLLGDNQIIANLVANYNAKKHHELNNFPSTYYK